ncbi:MAG: Subversion of eukaryotic traffic protein A [Chlamydiae bacterium]|nr:Subversion of eukaryotic traffic protein A [Chlamydiota bacterium]
MKLLKILSILPLLLLMTACDRDTHVKHSDDFTTLMGSSKSVWKFVETHEDFQNINQFTELYNRNSALQFLSQEEVKIPKVVHFVWLGPNPFPKESLENVRSWVDHHPNWTFKFWTDRRRPLPHSKMELHLVSDFNFTKLEDCFHESDNYGEKSDVLRYEILLQEGGLYVDHDVRCFKSFAPFHKNFDLYCGLEPPHQPVLSSSISICNNIIGVRPGHPVMGAVIDRVKERWEELGSAYPGNDKESIIYRVAQRTFIAFEDAVKAVGDKGSNKDIVFPAAYFNRIDEDFALFAHHYYASTWFEDETKFERNVRRRLISISRKNNQILLFNAVILSANLVLCACLIGQYRSIRKLRE